MACETTRGIAMPTIMQIVTPLSTRSRPQDSPRKAWRADQGKLTPAARRLGEPVTPNIDLLHVALAREP